MLPRLVPSSDVIASSAPEIFGAPVKIAASPATSRRRRSAGVFCARHGEEHLRHWLLHVDELRARTAAIAQSAVMHRRLASRRERCGHVCLEGSILSAARGAVVARWAGVFREFERGRGSCRQVPDNGGVYLVPAFAVWAARIGIRTRAA